MTTAILWFRRNLRLSDNPALVFVLENADEIVPAFILDPALLDSPHVGEKRKAFLFGGLVDLDKSLRARGSRLIVRQGEPLTELTRLAQETGAHVIAAERDFSPYALRRDTQIAAYLNLELRGDASVFHPDQVLKADGTPYTVFTPFSRAWKRLPSPASRDLEAAPGVIVTPAAVASLGIPAVLEDPGALFPPGESEGQRRLQAFVGGDDPAIYHYAERRNRPDIDGTSQLSPYLRFGMLSPRQAVVAAQNAIAVAPSDEARKGAETWLNELIWREFYLSILYHFPQVMHGAFRAEYNQISWHNDAADFAAWQEGRTGYPIVDAAMRQLAATGWMHNRARMIVASFLVKDLLIDWRWGERWFMQNLVDGDPAANNGGWQWTAGVGTDAAPYFRIFNPVLQGKRFDPAGNYMRRWIPVLAAVPDKFVHSPWEMPSSVQRQVGCIIGQDYSAPIVDHRQAREITLAAYAHARAMVA